MASSYTSFLIRHWSLADGGSRVMIEHIQTGEAIAVGTLDEALAWLGGRAALVRGNPARDAERAGAATPAAPPESGP